MKITEIYRPRKWETLPTSDADHLWYFLQREGGEGYVARTKMSHGMNGRNNRC